MDRVYRCVDEPAGASFGEEDVGAGSLPHWPIHGQLLYSILSNLRSLISQIEHSVVLRLLTVCRRTRGRENGRGVSPEFRVHRRV
jgi:hypothetical protein